MNSKLQSCLIILIGICTQQLEERLRKIEEGQEEMRVGQEEIKERLLAIEAGQRELISVCMCNGSSIT